MLNTRNEAMILGRPFLATIHAEIDVFNKEISLGIRDNKVTFEMDKKIHNFMNPVGKIYMINSMYNNESPSHSNAPSDKSARFEKSDNLHNENNYIHERSSKKTRILKADTNLPSTQFCKNVKTPHTVLETISPTDRAKDSPVITPLHDDPYMLVRQAYAPIATDIESEPFEDPIETEETQPLSHRAAPLSLDYTSASPDYTPDTPYSDEGLEPIKASETRTASLSGSTSPLSLIIHPPCRLASQLE
ncbi:hypothetical protein Tco_1436468 [Tanacetum coccineum]